MSEQTTTIQLPEPHYHQKKILILAGQDNPAEVIVISAGRRAGKSYALQMVLLQQALLEPNQVIFYICPSDNQSKTFFNEFTNNIQPAGIVDKVIRDKGDYRLIFFNKTTIKFLSARSNNNLRGGTSISMLIVDEASYVPHEVVTEVLLPQLATKTGNLKNKIIFASSPRGKANWFYEYYKLGQSDKPEHEKYVSMKFNIFDNPAIDHSFIETAKQTLTEAQYAQEILGEFTEQSAVFNNIEECSVLPEEGEEYNPALGDIYCGIDIGLAVDETVITLCCSEPGSNNEAVKVVYQFAVKGWLSTQIEDYIVALNKHWRLRKILIEQNSSGLPILTNLLHKHRLYNVEGFTTSNKSKSVIINQLSHLFNNKAIKLPNNTELKEQLNDFIVAPSESGMYNRYYGINGNDDRVMSLAIAVECWMQNKSSGEYNIQVLKF